MLRTGGPQIQLNISEALKKALQIKSDSKPMIKVKLKGTLAAGFKPSDVNLSGIYGDCKDSAILDIDKSDLNSADSAEKTSLLKDLKEKKISIDHLGLELIKKNLTNQIDSQKLEQIFYLLVEEELDKVEEIL